MVEKIVSGRAPVGYDYRGSWWFAEMEWGRAESKVQGLLL